MRSKLIQCVAMTRVVDVLARNRVLSSARHRRKVRAAVRDEEEERKAREGGKEKYEGDLNRLI